MNDLNAQNYNQVIEGQKTSYRTLQQGQHITTQQVMQTNAIQGSFQQGQGQFEQVKKSIILNNGVQAFNNNIVPFERKSLIIQGPPMRRSLIVGPTYQGQSIVIASQPFIQRPITYVTAIATEDTSVLRQQLQWKIEECESWRSKCEQYEMQIKTQITSITNEYDYRISEFQQEIERLNGQLRGKIEEAEGFRKYQRVSISQETEISSLNSHISNLQYELENALDAKGKLQRDCEEIRRKSIRLEEIITELEVELKRYSEDHTQFMNKIALLTQEIERLSYMNNQKEGEISNLKTVIISLEDTINKRNQQIQDMEGKIALLTQEIERLNAMNKSKQQIIDEYERRLYEYENKIALLTQEIERLNSMNNRNKSELENSNRKSLYMEQQLSQLSQLENDILLKKQEIQSWVYKYEETTKVIREKETIIMDYQGKIAMLTQEIERLNLMNRNKSDEIESWKIRFQREEQNSNSMRQSISSELETKIYSLTKEIESYQFQLKSKSEENYTLKSKLDFCLGNVILLGIEIEGLRNQHNSSNTTTVQNHSSPNKLLQTQNITTQSYGFQHSFR